MNVQNGVGWKEKVIAKRGGIFVRGYLHCLSSPIPPVSPSPLQRAVCAGTFLPRPGEVVNMAKDQRTFAANCIVSSSSSSSPG